MVLVEILPGCWDIAFNGSYSAVLIAFSDAGVAAVVVADAAAAIPLATAAAAFDIVAFDACVCGILVVVAVVVLVAVATAVLGNSRLVVADVAAEIVDTLGLEKVAAVARSLPPPT